MRMRDRIVVLVMLLLGIAGCATPQQKLQTAQDWERQTLGFIQDGVLTREQALLRMGEPTGRFENDRIFTYRLARDGPANFKVVPRFTDVGAPAYGNVDCNLVLVFQGNVLQKHSVVALR